MVGHPYIAIMASISVGRQAGWPGELSNGSSPSRVFKEFTQPGQRRYGTWLECRGGHAKSSQASLLFSDASCRQRVGQVPPTSSTGVNDAVGGKLTPRTLLKVCEDASSGVIPLVGGGKSV